jgi:hypothetical protein
MRTRRVTKLVSTKPAEMKYLACESCHTEEVEVDEGTEIVMCWRCVMKKVEPPIVKQLLAKVEGHKKPKGYHLKSVYVDPGGNVYHKGVEQPDLKGTLPSTPIKPKKTKAQKDAENEKKERKLVKLFKKKQEIKNNGNGIKSLVENTISQ